jgi:hypothetical protein
MRDEICSHFFPVGFAVLVRGYPCGGCVARDSENAAMSTLSCRFCKCTDESPRKKPDGDDSVVSFATGVCDMPDCHAALAAERARKAYTAKKNKPRRPSSADVHKDICRKRHGRRGTGQRKLRGLIPPKGGHAA